jgi:hypothetical protein
MTTGAHFSQRPVKSTQAILEKLQHAEHSGTIGAPMIFLVHYDRRAQQLLRFDKYDDADHVRAADDRLDLELSLLGSDRENEIVLFSAASEAALRVSHARYFYSLEELATAAAQSQGPMPC